MALTLDYHKEEPKPFINKKKQQEKARLSKKETFNYLWEKCKCMCKKDMEPTREKSFKWDHCDLEKGLTI